jgi:hypothetical protein
LSPTHDPQSGIVSLYGYVFRVELGPQGKLSNPFAIISQIDGSGIRSGTLDETREIVERHIHAIVEMST